MRFSGDISKRNYASTLCWLIGLLSGLPKLVLLAKSKSSGPFVDIYPSCDASSLLTSPNFLIPPLAWAMAFLLSMATMMHLVCTQEHAKFNSAC